MKTKSLLLALLISAVSFAQVGIGTIAPKGALDVTSTNTGIVVPRVTSIEVVTDGNGNSPVAGTVVYDELRKKMCYFIEGSWICTGKDGNGSVVTQEEILLVNDSSTYIKASNTHANDEFGNGMALSGDGNYLVVGAPFEDGLAMGINNTPINYSATDSGAVYVYKKTGLIWAQEAYIKASNAEAGDLFGISVSINNDGSIIAIGAHYERSGATGVNGNQNDNSVSYSGAAYIFNRTGSTWSQQAYLKASNTDSLDFFGYQLSLNGLGNYLVVSASHEDSNAVGSNGDQTNNNSSDSGAAYIFFRVGNTWSQQAYIKASNTEAGDEFGQSVVISSDGNRVAIGSIEEASNATGINGNQADNSAFGSGAVYVFIRTGTTWAQEAYVKASNTNINDQFGYTVALTGDGSRLVVGAPRESSIATGVNGNQNDNSLGISGAVYVIKRTGATWAQEVYIKASNPGVNDAFGIGIAIDNSGNTLIIGSAGEASNARGIDGDQLNNDNPYSSAVYVFKRAGLVWSQEHYIKSSNSDVNDLFSIPCSISNDGTILSISARREDSNAMGINGDQTDNTATFAGAVYIITPF